MFQNQVTFLRASKAAILFLERSKIANLLIKKMNHKLPPLQLFQKEGQDGCSLTEGPDKTC